MAFVIVTHLSPERESRLHDVLSSYTRMPMIVANTAWQLHADTVYVMPQGVVLMVEDGKLMLPTSREDIRQLMIDLARQR